MKVVSDTSPICYLLLIGEIEILSALYGRVFVPGGVAAELGHLEAPLLLRNWIVAPPSWLEIVETNSASTPELDRLQAGEREAILLTRDLEADLVILDDRQARDAALRRGLKVTGLIGILDQDELPYRSSTAEEPSGSARPVRSETSKRTHPCEA